MKTTLGILLVCLLLAGCDRSRYVYNRKATKLHDKEVGFSANDLLARNEYTTLKIEVQYMPGFVPDAAALDHLKTTLSSLLDKPGGIIIVTREIDATPKTSLTVDDLIEIERRNRREFTTDHEIAVYVLYTNGNYTDPNVLGVAYRNTSVALFGKKINDNSGAIGQTSRTKLVATVAKHEMGHLVGLVDVGSPMQVNHKDAGHGNHCNNNTCIMYYASETTDILGFLLTGNIPAFDAACKADMHANGGL